MSGARDGSASTPSSSGLPPRYEVRSSLGKGGMGRVFLCYDSMLDALLAVKMLAPQYMADDEAVEAMRNEARQIFKFHDCPNILRLHNVDQHEGNWYLVMEYAEGGSLDGRLKKEGRLSEGEARRLGAEVAEALDFAHRHKVLHRDVKPGNILLDKSGRVKVGDFGIAKLMDGLSAVTMHITGTPVYMAPEQILRLPMDGRTDQYSLGCMLFEMVAGVRPFTGAQAHIFLAKVGPDARVPDLREAAPEISEELAAIVRRTMALRTEERYPTCAELAAALREGASTVSEGGATITQSSAGPDTPTARPIASASRGAATVPVSAAPPGPPTEAVAPRGRRLPILLGGAGLLVAAAVVYALSSGGGETPAAPPAPAGTDTAKAKPVEPVERPSPPPPTGGGGKPPVEEPGKKPPPSPPDSPPKNGEKSVESPAKTVPAKEPVLSQPTVPPAKPALVKAVEGLPPPPAAVLEAQWAMSPVPEGIERDKDGRLWCLADGAEMVLVLAGEFTMGSKDDEEGAFPDEKPAHRVRLASFLVDRHEVTVGQFRRFRGTAGAIEGAERALQGQPVPVRDGNPVVCITWAMAEAYANWARRELPTEAQWEKAARGPESRRYPWGDQDHRDWYNAKGKGDDARGVAEVVTLRKDESPYGCLGMAGNVSEWCSDWYGENYYELLAGAVAEDPRGPENGEKRVARGGSWNLLAASARAATRQPTFDNLPKPVEKQTYGFRCVIPLLMTKR